MTYPTGPYPNQPSNDPWLSPQRLRQQEPSPHSPMYPGSATNPPGWRDEPPLDERRRADLRRQVALRLKVVNAKHCNEAFDRFGKRNALSPHCIVLFYTAPDASQPLNYQLLIATRLFLAGPESDDLGQVLQEVTSSATANITRANVRRQRWDPRGPEDSMVNGGDLKMPRDAVFVGTGVATLDTDQGSWYTVANAVRNRRLTMNLASAFDIAGQGIALLSDGTALHVSRDSKRRIGDDGITSSMPLDAYRARHWNSYPDSSELGDNTIRVAWAPLTALQRTLQDHLLAGRTS